MKLFSAVFLALFAVFAIGTMTSCVSTSDSGGHQKKQQWGFHKGHVDDARDRRNSRLLR